MDPLKLTRHLHEHINVGFDREHDLTEHQFVLWGVPGDISGREWSLPCTVTAGVLILEWENVRETVELLLHVFFHTSMHVFQEKVQYMILFQCQEWPAADRQIARYCREICGNLSPISDRASISAGYTNWFWLIQQWWATCLTGSELWWRLSGVGTSASCVGLVRMLNSTICSLKIRKMTYSGSTTRRQTRLYSGRSSKMAKYVYKSMTKGSKTVTKV